jgi:hypothetical protein
MLKCLRDLLLRPWCHWRWNPENIVLFIYSILPNFYFSRAGSLAASMGGGLIRRSEHFELTYGKTQITFGTSIPEQAGNMDLKMQPQSRLTWDKLFCLFVWMNHAILAHFSKKFLAWYELICGHAFYSSLQPIYGKFSNSHILSFWPTTVHRKGWIFRLILLGCICINSDIADAVWA